MNMPMVIVESPFHSDDPERHQAHVTYARLACRYCITKLHLNPYASHLFYTQPGILDDRIPEERMIGINAGLHMMAHATESLFFIDYGFSRGMRHGLVNALIAYRPYRVLSMPEVNRPSEFNLDTIRKTIEQLAHMVQNRRDEIYRLADNFNIH